MIPEGYPYLYETHLHTNSGSACGNDSPEDMVRACKEYGYTGIIITEHNWGGNTAIDRSLPWEEMIDAFAAGYERAKIEGDKIGLQVFFGWEAGYNGTEFLIYGLDKEWMKAHPEIRDADIKEQYELVKAGGGIVMQAHPFREEWYIPEVRLCFRYCDGCEAINATHSSHLSKVHNNPVWDELAKIYAKEHDFPVTAGSDVHSTEIFGGGVAFKEPVKDIHDFCERILSKEGYVLTNGDYVYNPFEK